MGWFCVFWQQSCPNPPKRCWPLRLSIGMWGNAGFTVVRFLFHLLWGRWGLRYRQLPFLFSGLFLLFLFAFNFTFYINYYSFRLFFYSLIFINTLSWKSKFLSLIILRRCHRAVICNLGFTFLKSFCLIIFIQN